MASLKFLAQLDCKLLKNFIFLSCLTISVSAAPNYLYDICSTDANFTANSTYAGNRTMLLAFLSSKIAPYESGFYSGAFGNVNDGVYGLFLCRGDIDTATCEECVSLSVKIIKQNCPVQKRAVIYYDECLTCYSDNYIFSRVDASVFLYMVNSNNISASQLNHFKDVLGGLLSNTVTEAVNSTGRFSVKKINFTALRSVYSLAQCTPDLSSIECGNCLYQVLNQLPRDKEGARILTPSCNVRYETYLFFNETFITVTPPPATSPRPVSPSPPPPLPPNKEKGKSSTTLVIAIVTPIAVLVVLFVSGYCIVLRRAKKYNTVLEDHDGDEITNVESLQYDLITIESATNKFSNTNMLGKGGFGSVYKGTLPNGQEIAVKRLSKTSGQGAKEFKNEVVLVAKLQHRNLVRVLGFCLEGKEKILVYEYVTNKSLDYFLFDAKKREELDWSRRYKIIGGVARGILYLHEDSHLRIIHRDLKASNILLDGDMNPKISDFGMSRIFGIDQIEGNTSRIVGTYGYMSPEYAMHGQFSVKSDAYSFGVLVLEMIAGKKNSSFYHTDGFDYLSSYAWKLWRDKTPLTLLDSTMGDSYSKKEVLRCIHIALLCVQEDPTERPTMAMVVLMLNSSTYTLPYPQEPAFFIRSGPGRNTRLKGSDSDQSTSESVPSKPLSMNEASITELHPR